ncbi:MAG: carbohydrate-binding protein [Myxococcota bacterium]
MQLDLRGRVMNFCAGLVVVSCAPQAVNSPEPIHSVKLPAADAKLPPTSSQGTPYAFRNVTILGGGFVSGIVFSPAKSGVAYARTDVGGIYRLDPTRRRWLPLTDMFGRVDSNSMGVESIAPDPVDPNKVYAAVGTYAQTWAPNGAILRSSDQGVSWQRTDMPIRMGGNEHGRSIGERLAVDPNKTDHLWFGSRKNGLWRSVDAGVTWNKVESFPQKEDPTGLGVGFLVFDAQSGKRGTPTPSFYAGMASGEVGLYVTIDGGASFKAIPKQPYKLLPSHAAFDARGTLYISYGNAPGPNDVTDGAVYKYDPKSGAFSNITPLAPNAVDRFGYGGLAVDIQHPGTLLTTTIDRWTQGDEIFRSTDGGQHWFPLLKRAIRDPRGANYLYFGRRTLGPPGWMGDIDIDPFDANHVMHVCGQGVWASDDVARADKALPTRWTFRNEGIEETVVTQLVSPPSGAPLLSGVADICGFRHDDLERSPPRGMHANPICNATSGLDFAAHQPEMMVRVGSLWGAGKHGAFSSDGGRTWTPFRSEPSGAESGGVIAISSDGASLLWSTNEGSPVYSHNRGKTWSKSRGLPAAVPATLWVPVNVLLASDRVNPAKLYAFDSANGVVYASESAGVDFKPTYSGLPTLAEWARSSGSIQALPGVEGDIWISTGKALFRSRDSGRDFRQLEKVEECHAVGFGIGAPDRSNPSVFMVGKVSGISGLFRSDDLGRTFVRINDDLHQFGFVTRITGDARRHGRVYVGTAGRGILVGDPR